MPRPAADQATERPAPTRSRRSNTRAIPWSGRSGRLEPGAEVLDHRPERRRREQDRLVAGDVVVERAHLVEVPGPDLGGAELLDLAVGRQQAGAVGLELAALPHDPELEREPEDLGEPLERLVGPGPHRGVARGLVEV